jgi:hypothetical protein
MSMVRVLYRERQRLTAADLRLEQEYRLGLGGRHHVTHHEWGVVRGLHLIAAASRTAGPASFSLTPGVAIDGYGREILVLEPVDLQVADPGKCWDVLIYYCEYPQQVPPGRACEDRPAPRISQRFKVVTRLHTAAAIAPEPEELPGARAAGPLAGRLPWPVLVAKVGDCPPPPGAGNDYLPPLIDYSPTRYVRHRAGLVRSPTGRASIQLGLSSRTDVYQFALWSRDDGRGLLRRIAIDRDGEVHVWRPLVISGRKAEGQAVLAQNRVLRVSTVMPAGIGRRIRIEGLLDPATFMLSAALRDVGNPRAGERPVLAGLKKVQATRPLSVRVPFGTARSAEFDLLDADLEPALLLSRRLRKQAQEALLQESRPPELAPQAFSIAAGPAGGQLALKKLAKEDGAARAVACGDVERVRSAAGTRDTAVVQFKPANEIEADPLARQIHAITTSKASDPVPETELRLSGGVEDETDASGRVSVGFRNPAGPEEWVPALRMDGGRRLAIHPRPATPKLDPLLSVEETVYLPPIRKDDPLLPDLLSMAFIAGLRQAGTSVSGLAVKVTLKDPLPPARFKRGGTLKYEVEITWTGATVVKRCLEIITGRSGNGAMAFRTIAGIDLQATGMASPEKFSIESERFTHPASTARIEIWALAKKGTVTGVAVGQSADFALED